MTSHPVCPHCGQVHRTGARFCPTTGLLIQTIPPPTAESPIIQRVSTGPGLTGRLPPNAILNNRYLILQKIGQGGMGAVYKTSDTRQPGMLWAVKEMSDAAITNPQEQAYALQCFQREAGLLQSLNHPNLPKVIDFFTEGAKHYLVMEFVQGQTLEDLMIARQQPCSEAEVASWGMQLCNVLAYLHGREPKIIFRDLKPGNIMFTSQVGLPTSGQVKLIDFGIARFFKPGQAKDTLALGTRGYAAPEAVSGQTDERSDIYSLCVTLHQLLTGYDPSSSPWNIPPARQINPAVSPLLERVLSRGLENQRDLRWQDAGEMLAALMEAQMSKSASPTTSTPVFTPTPSPLYPPSPVPALAPQPFQGLVSAPATVMAQDQVLPPSSGMVAKAPLMKISRPTTRLLVAASHLTPAKLALIFGGIVALLVVATWLLAPLFDEVPINWDYVPIMAMFGALGYAAFPKRATTIVTHTVLTTVLLETIWLRLDIDYYSIVTLALAAVISGALMEIWVFFIGRIKGDRKDPWKIEVAWLAAMEILGTVSFFGILTNWRIDPNPFTNPIQWIFAALFGAIGWFLGDLIQQYFTYRKTGFRHIL